MGRPARSVFAIAALMVLSITGCQHDVSTMTLDQALATRSEFPDLPIASPPRNIDVLRRYFDGSQVVPDNCHEQRNSRNTRLLRSLKTVQDESNTYDKERLAASLAADAERLMRNGEFGNTIELLNRLIISLSGRELGVRRAIAYSLLARLYAQLGDIEAAESARGKFELSYGSARKLVIYADPDWSYKVRTVLRHSIGGDIALAKNELILAEYHYRAAIDLWKRLVGPIYIDVNKLGANLAQVLMLQGRFVEAEAAARSTIRLLAEQRGGLSNLSIYSYTGEFAEPFVALAASLLAQGRTEDAAFMAGVAVNMHEVGCSEPASLGLVYARRILIDALAESRNWESVIDQVKIAGAGHVDQPEVFQSVFLYSVPHMEAVLRSENPRESLALVNDYRATDIAADAPTTELFAVSLESASLASQGDSDLALVKFAEIFPWLARIDANVHGAVVENRRVRFLHDYFNLLKDTIHWQDGVALEKDTSLELLKVSSALKLSRVGRAITESTLRNAAVGEGLSELVRQEQLIAQNIRVVSQRLAYLTAAPDYSASSASAAVLRQELISLNDARKVLLESIHRNYPKYREISSPLPLSGTELDELLSDNQTLLVYRVDESESFLWSVSARTGVTAYRLPIGYHELQDKVALIRQAVDPGHLLTLADIPQFNFELAYELYKILIEPALDSLDARNEIIVVPDGPLDFLSFPMLISRPFTFEGDERLRFDGYRDANWLAKTYKLSLMPTLESLRVKKYRVARETSTIIPFVGFGDPLYSPPDTIDVAGSSPDSAGTVGEDGVDPRSAKTIELRALAIPDHFELQYRTTEFSSREERSKILEYLPPLPDTKDEILAIAKALGATGEDSIFLGVDASESRLYDLDLSSTRYIAFATHGLISSDFHGLSGPALALSHPFHIEGSSQDGLLGLNEIYGLILDADMVILSACNTASADEHGGELVSGLGRAFFYAGSRSLLVSHWPVHSRATTELVSTMFELLSMDESLSESAALTESMMLLATKGVYRRNDLPLFSYAHPLFWAPFSLVGYGSN